MIVTSPRWKDEELKPEDALRQAIGYSLITSIHRNGPRGIPGQIIGRMPERVRKALSELRSEDIQDVRAFDTQNFG